MKIAEADPRKFDPRFSYGIIEPTYDLDDVLYRLWFDNETSELLINKMVIKGFHTGEDNELLFIELFDKLADANKYKTKYDHDYTTEAEVKVKAKQAHVVVNNIKIPKQLRKAMFRTSNSGEILHVQTTITKARAIKYGVSNDIMQAYAKGLKDKDPQLIRANKL